MGASERLPVLRVVMEQKMAFPEKSPWELSHCGKSYKSLNPVTALKILVLRSKVKVAKKKKEMWRFKWTFFSNYYNYIRESKKRRVLHHITTSVPQTQYY